MTKTAGKTLQQYIYEPDFCEYLDKTMGELCVAVNKEDE